MTNRAKWTRAFLWIGVVGNGIGLGAKLFDLLVVATSWGASPPESLALMPYGTRYPVDPGEFFQPLTILIILATIGALICGRKTTFNYKIWLWVPAITLLLICVFTPTVFWPMINELWSAGTGKVVLEQAQLTQLVNRWMIWDSMRAIVIAIGFLATIKAISIPYQEKA